MTESYIQNLFAERIGGAQYGKTTAIYKFEKIKRAKRAAMAAHPGAEIIDMGVGEPDEMAFPEVVDTLCREARKPENRGYADNGDSVLKQAAARYLERVCGVSGHQPRNRGDSLHRQQSGAVDSAGGVDQSRRLRPDDHAGLPGVRHPREVLRRPGAQPAAHGRRTGSCRTSRPCRPRCCARPRCWCINYPNNPTGASATPEFFAQVVAFAQQAQPGGDP